MNRISLNVEGLSVKRETVLAEPLTGSSMTYVIKNIPAYIYGLALDDTVHVIDELNGVFNVLDRSGQITIRVFVNDSLDREDIKRLIDLVLENGGHYEIGRNDTSPNGDRRSLLLLSLNIELGLAKIREIMRSIEGPGIQWEYGNVYDDNGVLLNWWV